MNIFLFTVTAAVFLLFGIAFGLLSRLAVWIEKDSQRSFNCRYDPQDEYNSIFKTRCGHDFYNAADDGDHVTSWMTYCPYCGGKVSKP